MDTAKFTVSDDDDRRIEIESAEKETRIRLHEGEEEVHRNNLMWSGTLRELFLVVEIGKTFIAMTMEGGPLSGITGSVKKAGWFKSRA